MGCMGMPCVAMGAMGCHGDMPYGDDDHWMPCGGDPSPGPSKKKRKIMAGAVAVGFAAAAVLALALVLAFMSMVAGQRPGDSRR